MRTGCWSRLTILLVLAASLIVQMLVPAGAAAHPSWFRQFGSGENDVASQVGIDAEGNVYAAARLWASLVVTSYTAGGDVRWTRQLSLGGLESFVSGLAVDDQGRSYAVGYANYDQPPYGWQRFVRAIDADGSDLWGLTYTPDDERSPWSVDVSDSGDVFVAGVEGPLGADHDPYIAKYDVDGNEIWIERLSLGGTTNLADVAVAGDESVYIVGQNLASEDTTFLARIDPAGTLDWVQNLPAADLDVRSLAADSQGSLLMAGHTTKTLSGQASAGSGDAFVRKLDPTGEIAWTRQFGTAGFDSAHSVSTDDADRAYVAGDVQGLLAGPSQITVSDPFVRTYDPDGNQLWTRQFAWGPFGWARPDAMSAAGDGTLVFAGDAVVEEPDVTGQITDAFVMKGVQPALPAFPSYKSVFHLTTNLPVSWLAASDAGSQIGGYRVDVRSASYRGPWSTYVVWRDVDAATTSATYATGPGATHCFRARSEDAGGGLVSAWTPDELCMTVPLDDAMLSHSPSWKQVDRDDYFLGTYSQSASKGATLRKHDVVVRRIGLVATRCPGCGTVDVLWNGALLRRIDLSYPTVARRALFFVKLFSSTRTGDVTIKIVSSGEPVFIDGLALSRVSGP